VPRFGGSRRDDNENEIVKALERVGASVYRLDAMGIPDLLVGFRRQMFLLEVKGEKGKLTKKQIEFRQTWRGPVPAIARTVNQALIAIGCKFVDDEGNTLR